MRTHYDNLQVARNASSEVLAAAYRALSLRYHPDRSDDPRCEQIMRIINSSYTALSDPVRRREHDDWIAAQEARQSGGKRRFEGAADTEPSRGARQPMRNAVLGRTDARAHVRQMGLLIGLAACACVAWLGGYTSSSSALPSYTPAPAEEPAAAGALAGLSSDTSAVEGASIDGASTSIAHAQLPDTAPTEFGLDRTAAPRPELGTMLPDVGTMPSGTMVASAPNGQPWPTAAGYVQGYERLRTDGLSKVTVDNGANASAMFVKLVAIDPDATRPVRQIYIPAGGTFTMRSVGTGRYDVRYEDLGTGELTRSDPFDINQVANADGTSFSNVTLTLFNVANGNMRTHRLLPSEF